MPTTYQSPSSKGFELLDATLDHLVADGELTAQQAHAVHDAYAAEASVREVPPPAPPTTPSRPSRASRLIEVGAYLGAALVAAGGALVVGQRWEELGQAGQLWLLAALTAAFAAAGAAAVMVSRRRAEHEHAVTRRLASTLLTLSAAAAAGLVLRAFLPATGRDVPESRVGWALLTAAVVAASVLVLTRLLAPSALAEVGLFGTVPAAAFGAMLVVGLPDSPTAPTLAFFGIGVGYALVALTTRLLTVPTLGLVLGLTTALVAATGETTTNRVLLAALAVACFTTYFVAPRWPLVTAGMLAAVALTFSVVGGALGSAVAFLVSGVVLLGLAAVALLRQQRGRGHVA